MKSEVPPADRLGRQALRPAARFGSVTCPESPVKAVSFPVKKLKVTKLWTLYTPYSLRSVAGGWSLG